MIKKIKIWFTTIDEIVKASKAESKKAKTSRLTSLRDILKEKRKNGFDALDYQVYGFSYIKDEKKRKTFLSTRDWSKINALVNKAKEGTVFVDTKKNNVILFRDLYKREVFLMSEVDEEYIRSFIDKHPVFFGKRDLGYAGKGVFRIDRSDFKDVDEILQYLKDTKIDVIEEFVVQHSELEKISPGCVCTIRVNTLINKEGEVHLLPSLCRMGEGDANHIVSGQFYAPINEEGNIYKPAFKQDTYFNKTGGEYFYNHPKTNEELVGFTVPFYKEVVEMAVEGQKRVPMYPFLGWDIAVSEKGPQLLEVNAYPANDIMQVYGHREDFNHEGIYREVMDWLELKEKDIN